MPEFAFIGRSNVGKSSLLNLLVGEQGLARVSPTPGFTKHINIFTINKSWRLIDLPGYGYAHAARTDQARFSKAVMSYLKHRANLSLVFALLDSGLPPQAIDLEFAKWLVHHEIPFVFVFTKSDRVPPGTVKKNMEAFSARISSWFVEPPMTLLCSAKAGQGRTSLLAVIEERLAAIRAEARMSDIAAPGSTAQDRLRENQKRRPDLNRPW